MRNKNSETTLVGAALALQADRRIATPREERKHRGQFFTPSSVANFMASLPSLSGATIDILDPGAGLGILSAAVSERVLGFESPRKLHFELYETDPTLLQALDGCMESCGRALRAAGHEMSFCIHEQDFILALAPQTRLFDRQVDARRFDLAIMNPPYYKLSKDSPHARAMREVIHGQPNIYALFMALAADLLRQGGELVAITPRIFCNGPYFRGFRRRYFEHMSLERVHLFESRTDTFRESSVLQESVITYSIRTHQSPMVRLSTSGRSNLFDASESVLRSGLVLDDSGGDNILRIPETSVDASIMTHLEAWPFRFTDLGLRVSTGPVVSFRAKPFLRQALDGVDTVPLLSVHNVRAFEVLWPVTKGMKPTALKVTVDSAPLLVPAKNYVPMRRFTAKEERRRLVAGAFLSEFAIRPLVALENHLNFVYHESRDLTTDETRGLTALFNSALLDRYFRTISGNTQVNAAEIRSMPLPSLETIARIGHRTFGLQLAEIENIEAVILEELGVSESLQLDLAGATR